MKSIFYLLALMSNLFFLGCQKETETPLSTEFYLPGEWTTQQTVWLGTPTYENKAGYPTQLVQFEIIKNLVPTVNVAIAVQDSAEQTTVLSQLAAAGLSQNVIQTKIKCHIIPHNDIWWRDMGGIFLKNNANQLQMVDFNFNGWGYGAYTTATYQAGFGLDETVDRQIAAQLDLSTVTSQLILEGGAIESNGKGTILVAESVVFQRNPTMTKTQVEAELKRVLKVKKIIWLPRGLGSDVHTVEGSPFVVDGKKVYTPVTTNGHTDEFVRFVDEHTLILAEIPEAEATDTIARFSRTALLEAENILKNATDQDGQPFKLIRMPDTGTILEQVAAGDGTFDFLVSMSALHLNVNHPIKVVLASSYLNYMVSNEVVLVAKYARADRAANLQQKDAQAVNVLKTAFPNRKIVQIDASNINVGGGGMHCITQQVPK
jgi:agmatine deiminase